MTADFDAAANACRAREAEFITLQGWPVLLQEIARWLNPLRHLQGPDRLHEPISKGHGTTTPGSGKEHEERRKRKKAADSDRL